MKLTLESCRTLDPSLGGTRREEVSGLEPSLSREFGPLYGRFHVYGLEAPSVEGRRRPMVVFGETDFDTGQLVKLVADSNGYDVSVSNDGKDVLNLTQSKRPDFLVVNIRLNRMPGLEVIRQVRSSTQSKIPILVMDVQRRRQDVLDSFGAGADDYLIMPYDLPVLLRCWRRVSGAQRRPSPLTALQNEDAMVQQMALSYLIERRPDGLGESLLELYNVAEPALQLTIRWALRRLGSGI